MNNLSLSLRACLSTLQVSRSCKKSLLNVAAFRSHSSARPTLPSNPHYQWSYVCGPGHPPLLGSTVGQLVNVAADTFGDREGVVVEHQKIRKTFWELRSEIDHLATGFVAMGLKRGDRIGIWGPNSYEWYLTQFAAARAGMVLVNINPAYQSHELLYCLNKVSVRAIVSAEAFKTQKYYDIMCEIMPEIPNCPAGEVKSTAVPSLEKIIMMTEHEHKGTFTFKHVMHSGGSQELKVIRGLDRKIQPDDATNLQFTSGTTGNPKGATLSHHNIVNNAFNVGYRLGYHLKPHRICVSVPLYHCFGNVAGTLCSMIHGATCVLPAPSFNGLASVQTAQEEKCTSIYGTPTMFVDMLDVQRQKKFDLSSVETGLMSGAPCPQELCKNVVNEMNMKDFVVAFGSTETSPVTFQGFLDDPMDLKTSTIGYPANHVEVKIIDTDGRIVPVGEPGELCTRGYSTMLGYWEDEQRTKEAITPDRWFHSGDQAVIYENGYGQIVGRMKDMVIRGGENIYPREIEEVLHQHPNIKEAQVFGVPDKRLGEELCAWITLTSGTEEGSVAEEEVREFFKGKISHFKIPKYIMFVESFPSTVTGKIQKFKMREIAGKQLGLID